MLYTIGRIGSISKFIGYRDSNIISNQMRNKDTGGYITIPGRNRRYKGGIIMNGYYPRLYS
jgi:hypothetical protein